MSCNILTYIAGILFFAFIIYVYTSKLPLESNEGFGEDLTSGYNGLYSPFCAERGERDCVNTPGCEWTIDNNYNGSCRSNTTWYSPWYNGWYNWYNTYWSPWRWRSPYYTSSYPYYGRRRFWRGGGGWRGGGWRGGGWRSGGGRIGGGRIGGGRIGGGRSGGGRSGGRR